MHVSMAVSLGPHQIADELAAQRHARAMLARSLARAMLALAEQVALQTKEVRFSG